MKSPVRSNLLVIPSLPLILCVAACAEPELPRPSEGPIYATILERIEASGNYERILLRQQTIAEFAEFHSAVFSPVEFEIPERLWRDFQSVNEVPISLADSLSQPDSFEFLPRSYELDASNDPDYWEAIHPVAFGEEAVIVGLSRPSFSRDRTTALILYEISWGRLAGVGRFALLRKEGEKWSIVEEDHFWVS